MFYFQAKGKEKKALFQLDKPIRSIKSGDRKKEEKKMLLKYI